MLAALLAPALTAQAPKPRRCNIVLERSDRDLVRDEPIPGNENIFAGGNVQLRCAQQPVFLGGDSLASFNGDVIQLITKAYYRDEDVRITADTLMYTRLDERLQARGNVVATNRTNGSTLTGPWVDHYRAVRGIRDSAETTALQRPTLRYAVPRAAGDTADPAPYVIEADRMRAQGSSRMEGWGGVIITRDSLRGLGDSVLYLTGETRLAILRGELAQLRRRGADSFTVIGREVQLGLEGGADDLDAVRAYGEGRVTNGASDIIADSVSLAFTGGMLAQTLAWDREALAQVLAEGYDIRGDSIAVDTPGERLRELRVFQRGILQSPVTDSVTSDSSGVAVVDSLAAPRDSMPADTAAAEPPIRDQMTGNRIIARFMDVDSAGTLLTRLVDIVATGSATSLYSREVMRNGRLEPTINYTRADTIIVLMKTGDSTGVSEVRAFRGTEPVDGVQLERASLERTRRPTPPGAARPEERP